MFYSLVPILALVTMFVTNFDILFNRRYLASNVRALKAYRIFLSTIFVFYVIDILWGFLDPLPDKTPVTIVTDLYFLAMAGVLFAWSNFVVEFVKGLNVFKVIIRIAGVVFALLGVALVFANIFTPVVFSYDSSVYVPQYWRYIFLGLQISTFALMAVFAFVATFFEKDYKKSQLYALSLFSLIIAGSVTAQLYYPILPLYSAGLTVGTVLIYSFIVVTQRIEMHHQLLESKNREEKQLREIADTRHLAYIDPLTRTKNKHAYVEFESEMDQLIHDDKIDNFSLIIFDLNDLKFINDNYGHEAGDKYIIDSCELISSLFIDAPIYRFGGDEFIVYLTGDLFKKRFELLDKFNAIINENNILEEVAPVIAAGESSFIRGKDNTLRTIFLRADEKMYARKRRLKEIHNKNVVGDETTNKVTGASLISIKRELYDMIYRSNYLSLIDMLNGSSCDDILEIDINHDTFKQVYHAGGKYFVPATGLSYKDLVEFTANHVVHPDDKSTYLALMSIDGFFERLKNAFIPNFDFAHFRYRLLDGSYRWVEQVVIAGEEYGISEGMFRLYVIDINNVKTRQLGKITNESIVASVGRDQMTGLLISKDFITESEEMISKDKGRNWCLVSIDIEHFKLFDEWFGMEKGNYLLAKIGAILKDFEDKGHAIAGYFGADDFNVVCEYNPDKIKNLYDQIHDLIISFGLSAGFLPAFGVARIEQDMSSVDAFDRTAICIAKAKQDIRNRICYYTDEMQHAVEQEHRVLTEFINALKSDEITFYLQPQCHASTGKVIGAEALARWVKADGTVIPPGHFVPILEKYGFITDLDRCIWDKVCVWLKKWTDEGHKPVPISVNVSRIDLFNIDIVDHFSNLVEKYNISPKLLEIEITESAYVENMNIADQMVKDLRAKGFKVALDDFGSGYSSLNMLSTLKIDAIKLDAKFLQINDENHQRGIHVLESVITMAKGMSLPMVVEGVETKGQIDFLDQFGVRYIQGFYFYKPLPVIEFEKIIEDEKNIDSRGIVIRTNEQFRIREFLDKNIYSDSMLNNVIGPVAIYSVRPNNQLDIIRYNQQFMEAVNVPDFVDKLENIEKTMPEADRELIFKSLEEAKDNKLMGSTGVFRFLRVDGILSSFKMHFYYLGRREGSDRFYGSVSNVTDLVDLQEGKTLLSRYSTGNIILIRHVADQWKFDVLSHNLADIIGIDPVTLEKELNSGSANWRVSKQSQMRDFIELIENTKPVKGKTFEKEITVYNIKGEPVQIKVWIENVGGETNNFAYILRTERL